MSRELGRGGEGVVYDVRGRPDQVAKIWHAARADTDDARTTARKIRHMVQQKPNLQIDADGPNPQQRPCVVWPDAVIFDENRRTVGFLMPKVGNDRFHSSFRYFNPASRRELETQRRQPFMARDPFIMARNLALAVGKLHQSGYVVGDINEQNILVNNLMEVAIVDADSMQVTDAKSGETLRCTKGREDYTSPRLQGLRFREHDRSPNDDLFGMAVLIFKITMQGVHPYASTSNPDDENAVTSLGQKIKLQYFPYNESGHTPPEHQPSQAYRDAWQSIPFDLRHLFRLAFDPETAQRQRPSPELWARALNRIIAEIPSRERWETPPPAATAKPASRPRRNEERNRQTAPSGGAFSAAGAAPGRSGTGLSPPAPPARRGRTSWRRTGSVGGRRTSTQIRPRLSVAALLGPVIAFLVMSTVTMSLTPIIIGMLDQLYLTSVESCRVTTETGSELFLKLAPENPEQPGVVSAINWAEESVAIQPTDDGRCIGETVLYSNVNYYTPGGVLVDLHNDTGDTTTSWQHPESVFSTQGTLITLLGLMMAMTPVYCILIGYTVGVNAIRAGNDFRIHLVVWACACMSFTMIFYLMAGGGLIQAASGDLYVMYNHSVGVFARSVIQPYMVIPLSGLAMVFNVVIRGTMTP